MNDAQTLQVLLVEDDEDDYFLTRALLGKITALRLELHWARSFDAALQHFAANPVDVCLIDFHLGKHSGLKLLQTLHETPLGHAHPALVMLTGDGDRDANLEAMRAGADDYLIKSQIDADSLEHALRYAVARHHRAQALQRGEERFRLAARAAGEVVWEWNRATNELWWSDEFATTFGCESPDFAAWSERLHPEDRERVVSQLVTVIESDAPHWSCEFRFRRSDGTFASCIARGLVVLDSAGATLRVCGTMSDISERKAWEEQLVHRAFHDPLTNLPNRALFMDRLERALSRTRRNSECRFAVIFLDLDGFKSVNDTHGHLAGDALLRDVAERLGRAVRPQDTVARIGGDEFAALLDDIADEDEATQVAQRIHDTLAVPVKLAGNHVEMQIGASIGIALGSPKYARPDDILRDADIAMYRAKAALRANDAR